MFQFSALSECQGYFSYRIYFKALILFCSICFCGSLRLASQEAGLAQTPPMGWNSWDAYGTTVREAEVKANADVMSSQLKPYGWQYIIVDIQWYEPLAQAHGYRPNAQLTVDAYGRLTPAVNRFPSAADGKGFKALADYVHREGLKFGIHILRGIPRQAVTLNTPILGTPFHARDIADQASICRWNSDMYGVDMAKPGAQAYYDSLVALYAQWGVDFIKADDMSRPYHKAEIQALHMAIQKAGRPIVLSLSPGPAPLSEIDDLRGNAQMWRIEDDLWDDWKSLRNMYFRAEAWAPYVQEGHWPDADMLPLGRIGIRAERGEDRSTRLSHEEQRTMMTVWSMLRSPLMFGGDLGSLDNFTKSLLTNSDLLAVDQNSTGAVVSYKKGDLRAWTAKDRKSHDQYLAIINLAEEPASLHEDWNVLGIKLGIKESPSRIRELWSGETLKQPRTLNASIPAHGALIYRVSVQ